MSESVETRWRSLLSRGDPETREVDAESALRMLIGVSPVGRPYFVVIATRPVGLPDLPVAIEVTRRQRATDGKWTLTLELQVRGLTDAFLSLMSDLAARSAAASDEVSALDIFFETLNEWRELLTWKNERLSESALRGLVAELWFGFFSGEHEHTPEEAVKAWVGPLKGAQDYEFLAPGFRYEVKSLRPTRAEINISSIEQLDGENIRLAVVTLVEAESGSDSGLTLPDLVRSIRAILEDGSARSEFNLKFLRLGVDLDDPWYREHSYMVTRLRLFEVVEAFPALRRSGLPEAIERVEYRLDTDQIAKFTIIDSTIGSSGLNG